MSTPRSNPLNLAMSPHTTIAATAQSFSDTTAETKAPQHQRYHYIESLLSQAGAAKKGDKPQAIIINIRKESNDSGKTVAIVHVPPTYLPASLGFTSSAVKPQIGRFEVCSPRSPYHAFSPAAGESKNLHPRLFSVSTFSKITVATTLKPQGMDINPNCSPAFRSPPTYSA